jgi:hypothetical protein
MKSAVARLTRVIAARRAVADDRRHHDDAMAIPRVAMEHATQVLRARERGETGCRYCP